MIPRVDGAAPTGKYEDPDLYFPLFTALQVCASYVISIINMFSWSYGDRYFHRAYSHSDHVSNDERPDFQWTLHDTKFFV